MQLAGAGRRSIGNPKVRFLYDRASDGGTGMNEQALELLNQYIEAANNMRQLKWVGRNGSTMMEVIDESIDWAMNVRGHIEDDEGREPYTVVCVPDDSRSTERVDLVEYTYTALVMAQTISEAMAAGQVEANGQGPAAPINWAVVLYDGRHHRNVNDDQDC